MSKIASLQTIGDWGKGIDQPIENALMASIDMMGLSGRDACTRALVFMAQSAAKLTPQAKKRRKVKRDANLGPYVEIPHESGVSKAYRWQFMDGAGDMARALNQMGTYGTGWRSRKWSGRNRGTWENAQKINRRGLAKRSWQWTLEGIKAPKSKPIAGVGSLREIIGESTSGLIGENRLNYISKIMPAGWEHTVQEKASGRIMATAAKIAERRFAMEIPRLAKRRQPKTTLARSFKKQGTLL